MFLIETATRLQSLGLVWPAVLILVKATVILAIARLLIAAIPNLSAAAKHLVLTVALCGVVALPLLEFAIPSWRIAVLRAPVTKPAAQSKEIGATGDEDDAPPKTAVAAALTVAKAAGVVPQSKINALWRGIRRVRESWQGFLLLSTLAVSIAFLLRMLVGVISVHEVARRAAEITNEDALRELGASCGRLGLPRPVRLLRSDRISVPAVWGLPKPVLILPASWNEWPAERLRVVLLHELAHVKRADIPTLLVTRAAVALFWFHPLMWTLERAARAEAERACDDVVLDSGTKPSDYAEHLLSIEKAIPQVDPFRSVTLAMSRRSPLEGRLRSILQPHVRRAHLSLAAIMAVAALAFLLLVPFASVRLVAAPQQASSSIDVYADREETQHPSSFDLAKLLDTTDVLVAKYEQLTSKHTPESGKEWYQQGYRLHSHGHYEEAIPAFRQSIAHGYRVEDSMYNIACAYAKLDDAASSLKWLHDAINAGYNDYDHIAHDDDFDAIRSDVSFQRLVAGGSEESRQHDGRLDNALHRYEMLQNIPDADGEAWFSAGYDLLALRKFDESIEAFGKAAEKGYKPATSLYNMACGYSRKGDTGAAADYLERALDEGFDSPDKFEDDRDLDNVRRDPRFAELKKIANDLRLRAPNIVDSILGKGEGWDEALPRFRDMTRNYPNTGRSWFNLGYAALQAGKNRESVAAFQHALTLNYRVPTTTYNIACAYARSDHKDAAIEWLQKAREAGFDLKHYLDDDADLLNLRWDPRFRDLRREVRDDTSKEKAN